MWEPLGSLSPPGLGRVSMKNHLIVSAMLFGLYACDARVDRDYQGEALLKVSGALLLGDSALPRDAVPALAFEGASDFSLEILDG